MTVPRTPSTVWGEMHPAAGHTPLCVMLSRLWHGAFVPAVVCSQLARVVAGSWGSIFAKAVVRRPLECGGF